MTNVNKTINMTTESEKVEFNVHCQWQTEESVNRNARRQLILATTLSIFFMIGEIIGGYLSGSPAIASDAAHLLTDVISFLISLFSLWLSSKPASEKMPFGWHRSEVIGSLISILLIWVLTGAVVYLAIQRIITNDYKIDALVMIITSVTGVVFNLIMLIILHQSNSCSESKQSINVQAAFIHVLGNLIQSFGVLIAALVIYFRPNWSITDPFCTFLFSILVVITTITVVKENLIILMEAPPKGQDLSDVLNVILNIDNVQFVHNLRIWSLNLNKVTLSAHIAICPGVNSLSILSETTKIIKEKYKFHEITLQIEESDENMSSCKLCQISDA